MMIYEKLKLRHARCQDIDNFMSQETPLPSQRRDIFPHDRRSRGIIASHFSVGPPKPPWLAARGGGKNVDKNTVSKLNM